jgi:hypothetical protein
VDRPTSTPCVVHGGGAGGLDAVHREPGATRAARDERADGLRAAADGDHDGVERFRLLEDLPSSAPGVVTTCATICRK